jgi:hypothetical protein
MPIQTEDAVRCPIPYPTAQAKVDAINTRFYPKVGSHHLLAEDTKTLVAVVFDLVLSEYVAGYPGKPVALQVLQAVMSTQ